MPPDRLGGSEDPGISVVLVGGEPADEAATLQSLADQTSGPDLFEVVIVRADCSTGPAAPRLERDLKARIFRTDRAPRVEAARLGLLAARGTRTLFLRAGDRVTPGALAALSARADDEIVPVLLTEDIRQAAGRSPGPGRLPAALESLYGKLIPTRVAVAQHMREPLASSDTGPGAVLFWVDLWAAGRFSLRVLDAEDDAAYLPFLPDEEEAADADPFAATVLPRLELIEQLEARSSAPSLQPMAQRLVAAQAERIRDFLVLHPQRQRDVVQAVRRRGLTSVPWDVVNRGRAGRLALLYCFVPSLDTSALVAARRLDAWGVVTDVISQDLGNLRAQDPWSELVSAPVVDQSVVLSGNPGFGEWSTVVSFCRKALAEIEEMESAKGTPYEAVYSRAMAPHSHFAAALLKLRSPSVHWVAEFSDPLDRNAYGQTRVGDLVEDWVWAELSDGLRRAGVAPPQSRRLFEWAEIICYALADEIIFTNEHQLEFMLGYCRDRGLAERATAIARAEHHPAPDPALYQRRKSSYPLRPDAVNIGYFGNFYANRGLGDILRALEALPLWMRERVHLHLFTTAPEKVTLEVIERGLSDVITANPMLGYLTYLNLTTRFDVLLITDFDTRPHYEPNPFLPAKLADYAGSGVPIWAIAQPGSILSGIPVAYSSVLADGESITETLRAVIERSMKAATSAG